jgi:F-type H+-transporting ATPase subunit c
MKKSVGFVLVALLTSIPAFAEEAATTAVHAGMGDKGLFALGLGLMLGLGAFGATLGQGRVGSSAMEGLARNPQARNTMFVPMILGLVFIESLFILTWVLAFLVNAKI